MGPAPRSQTSTPTCYSFSLTPQQGALFFLKISARTNNLEFLNLDCLAANFGSRKRISRHRRPYHPVSRFFVLAVKLIECLRERRKTLLPFHHHFGLGELSWLGPFCLCWTYQSRGTSLSRGCAITSSKTSSTCVLLPKVRDWEKTWVSEHDKNHKIHQSWLRKISCKLLASAGFARLLLFWPPKTHGGRVDASRRSIAAPGKLWQRPHIMRQPHHKEYMDWACVTENTSKRMFIQTPYPQLASSYYGNFITYHNMLLQVHI